MMKVLSDEGGGITEESLEYFSKHFIDIGRVFRITCSSDDRIYNTELEGEKGIMLLSGFSCGYSGTGPRGLYKLLILLGWVGNFQDIAGTHLFETRI